LSPAASSATCRAPSQNAKYNPCATLQIFSFAFPHNDLRHFGPKVLQPLFAAKPTLQMFHPIVKEERITALKAPATASSDRPLAWQRPSATAQQKALLDHHLARSESNNLNNLQTLRQFRAFERPAP
jgi:hypothetical protein